MAAEATRQKVIRSTDENIRQQYEQYLTPRETAFLAVSMFSDINSEPIKCLDLGAGTGILSTALFERYGKAVDVFAVELDEVLAKICDKELSSHGVPHQVFVDDAITKSFNTQFDRVILNPPYKKMATTDSRQNLLPVSCPNLYAAFIMKAVQVLRPNGECVAIVPRSWTNGEYFSSFRNWLYQRVSIDWIHVYGSRTDIFSDTNVLQETVLLKLSKKAQAPVIRITESVGKNTAITLNEYPDKDVICGFSGKKIVQIKPVKLSKHKNLFPLRIFGLLASTGKVVDFRSRDKTMLESGKDRLPLIYPCNFTKTGFCHPVQTEKKQWFWCRDEKDKNLLLGPGNYVIVKRFSSKEEKKRVKAYAFNTSVPVALENHLNFIHAGNPRNAVPLTIDLAKGLSIWLNSTVVDEWFRSISGSTQVNASDLNRLPTPCLNDLKKISVFWKSDLSQEEIDRICGGLINE